jgi:hypothetical protein
MYCPLYYKGLVGSGRVITPDLSIAILSHDYRESTCAYLHITGSNNPSPRPQRDLNPQPLPSESSALPLRHGAK